MELGDKEKKIAKAVSEWIGTDNEVSKMIAGHDDIVNYIHDEDRRLQTVENILLEKDKKARDLILKFFSNIYDEKTNNINWEQNLNDVNTYKVLETYIKTHVSGKDTLEEAIKVFFKSDFCILANNARNKRNRIHGPLSQNDKIEVLKSNVLGLFAVSAELMLKSGDSSQGEINHFPKDSIRDEFKERLTRWYDNNNSRFNLIDDKFKKKYLENIDRIISTIVKSAENNKHILDTMSFLFEKIGEHANVEMIPDTDIGEEIDFESIFLTFLKAINGQLLSPENRKDDWGLEQQYELFEKLAKQVSVKHSNVLEDIHKGLNNAKDFQEGQIIKENFNTHFF